MNVKRPSADVRITYAWVIACTLTILSWGVWMARGGSAATANRAETFVVLALAAVKARLIIREFMEVREAPPWLRRFTDTWIVLLWVTLVGTYLY